VDRIVRKPTETELHPNNMNKEVGFCLSKSWSHSSAASRNFLNMMPDLKGYEGQYMLAISSSEATGSMLPQ
jgi:hypothetical protein